jgi:hypothetical protein
MNFTKSFKGLLFGLAVLLATSAFASNKASIQFLDTVNIGGQQVKAGDYSIKWEGNGPNVELSILKGSKVVATTPARLVDLNQSPGRDTAVTKTAPDGSRQLSQIQIAGKKFAIAIGQESADAGGNK